MGLARSAWEEADTGSLVQKTTRPMFFSAQGLWLQWQLGQGDELDGWKGSIGISTSLICHLFR